MRLLVDIDLHVFLLLDISLFAILGVVGFDEIRRFSTSKGKSLELNRTKIVFNLTLFSFRWELWHRFRHQPIHHIRDHDQRHLTPFQISIKTYAHRKFNQHYKLRFISQCHFS